MPPSSPSRPRPRGELDPFQGRATHAIFLNLTAWAAPGRATALHDSNDLKPFTSSNLIGLRTPEGSQRAVVQPGAACRWRVTAFELGLAGLWLERILPHLLTAYRFWCGTGHKTTHGLGQTRTGR